MLVQGGLTLKLKKKKKKRCGTRILFLYFLNLNATKTHGRYGIRGGLGGLGADEDVPPHSKKTQKKNYPCVCTWVRVLKKNKIKYKKMKTHITLYI